MLFFLEYAYVRKLLQIGFRKRTHFQPKFQTSSDQIIADLPLKIVVHF